MGMGAKICSWGCGGGADICGVGRWMGAWGGVGGGVGLYLGSGIGLYVGWGGEPEPGSSIREVSRHGGNLFQIGGGS